MAINKMTLFVFLLTLLYMVFHIGRYYEKQQVIKNLQSMFENTTDADFIIPDNLPYGGEMAIGNCVYGEKGGESMTKLGKYTYGW